MLLLTIVFLITTQCNFVYTATDEAYVIGLFPEPVYDSINNQKSVFNFTANDVLRVTVKNPGSSSENIGYHAYLPETATMLSFSMTTEGTSYQARKSNRVEAEEVMKRAHKEDHSAIAYIPKELKDEYENEFQTASTNVRIRGGKEMTFNLEYNENALEVIQSGKKFRSRARVVLDLYGITVGDLSMEIASPSYPNSYPDNADIEWWIRVPNGKTVFLRVIELDIEECCDQLTLYDGASRRNDVIAELTGEVNDLNNHTFQSTRNSMFLRLRTDCTLSYQGFKAIVFTNGRTTTTETPVTEVTTQRTNSTVECLPTATNYPHSYYTYSLYSPNYPNPYGNNLNMCWLIRSPYYNYVVQLTVDDLDLESCCDYVKVYDGENSTYQLLAKLSDQSQKNSVYYSKGASMYINFRTDHSVTSRGFHFYYTAVYSSTTTATNYPETTAQAFPACTWGDHIYLYPGSYGYISSPNYPYDYLANSNCTWNIHGYYSDYVVKLNIYNVKIAYNDIINIYDGSSANSQLLRSYNYNSYDYSTLYSTGINMYIEFITDDNHESDGFQFRYEAFYSPGSGTEPVTTEITNTASSSYYCSEITQCNADRYSRTFSSPGYPYGYYDNMDCSWRIQSAYNGYVVRLRVIELLMESCCDYLDIYDGSSSSYYKIARLTGSNNNTTYLSTGRYMYLNFKTDGSVTRTGFSLDYMAIYDPPTTVNYPESTSQVMASACNLGDNIYLHPGNDSGYIYSPNYPLNYYSNSHCTWAIRGYHSGHIVGLYIYEIDLASYDDTVSIYDGSSSYYPLLRTFYYYHHGYYEVYSNGMNMFIEFNTDYYEESRGFRFFYTTIYSPGAGTEPVTTETTDTTSSSYYCSEITQYNADRYSRTFSSPGYPYGYYNNMYCSWNIYNPYSGYVIQLTIADLSIENNYDFLYIYDGYSPYYELTATLTGSYHNNSKYLSTGPYMYIVFTSDHIVNDKGFKLQYQAVYEQPATTIDYPPETTDAITNNCSIKHYISNDQGWFSSMNYPSSYPSYINECWFFPSNYKYYYIYSESFGTHPNDVLRFRDEYGELASFSGYYHSTPLLSFYSTNVYAQFQSNSNYYYYSGFNITFTYY